MLRLFSIVRSIFACTESNHSVRYYRLSSFIANKYLVCNGSMAPAKSSKRKSVNTDSKSQDETVSGDHVAKKTKSSAVLLEKADTPKPKQTKMNKVDTDLDAINFSCAKTNKKGEKANFKIASWNVAGIRACIKKNGIDYIAKEDADIICLQEVKCSESKLPPEVNIKGYHRYWHAGLKEGYAGVCLYSKEKPLNVKYGLGKQEYDSEGRLITAEYDKFYVVGVYVPNAGQGLRSLPRRIQWDVDFRKYVKSLDQKKPVILVGDLNVSHKEIDLANPKTNTKSAGFTQEERDGMTALLSDGFVDSFREFYPDRTGAYSYWTYIGNARSRNVGWRLDYFIVSERLMENVCDNVMRTEVYGSDHCPVVLYLSV